MPNSWGMIIFWLIVRYSIEGKGFIEVTNFAKHQNPHRDERASTIQASCKQGASTVGASLIPDSLLLIPDSLSIGSSEPKNRARSKPVSNDDWLATLLKVML